MDELHKCDSRYGQARYEYILEDLPDGGLKVLLCGPSRYARWATAVDGDPQFAAGEVTMFDFEGGPFIPLGSEYHLGTELCERRNAKRKPKFSVAKISFPDKDVAHKMPEGYSAVILILTPKKRASKKKGSAT